MKTNDTKTEITTGKEQTIQINRLHDSTSSQGSTVSTNAIDQEILNRIPKHPGNPPYDIAKQLITHDEIVGHDYQGWPLYQLRVISLLHAMGVSDEIIKQIPENILKAEISSLEEDGMGYGVNEECIVNCAIDKNKNIVYLWRMPLTSVNNAN